jgi:hypothetical protein
MFQVMTWFQVGKAITTLDFAVLVKTSLTLLEDFMRCCGTPMATKSIEEACKNFTGCIVTTQGKMYLEL